MGMGRRVVHTAGPHRAPGERVSKQQAPRSSEGPAPLIIHTLRWLQVLFRKDALRLGYTEILMSRNEENFISSA